ncbi:MAG: VOC family protein [Burkholderiaceae bacterium]|uniref:Extradiol dioxygenase (2,4,5-trihydroxytoluate oxygenase) n=1 Tax=Sym plasmid TaxID=28430 RepID=A0A515HID8_9ZZZZ|nr:VOC family protein [Burkholderiaceae bacterium]QDL89192.1 extradiol dioxygenase (2,4,5-trihydroxytoluate oxygenase) [Sym plasmid]
MAITDIAYLVYGHTDLEATERFYTDFGLTVAYRIENEIGFRPALARGYCYVACKASKPGLRAIAFNASERADLDIAARFPEASPVTAIGRDGGGDKVTLKSPDGLPFEIVHGIQPYEALEVRPVLKLNTGRIKRRRGEFQRPRLEPAAILRLGHVALLTNDFKRNFEWMQSRLGLRPSDIMYGKDEDDLVGSFMHLSGGGEWTDHHSLALFPDPHPRVHHFSFEVEDIDAQGMGNQWMSKQGWKHSWGIGRHIYGSQIFDYWFDPDGNIAEHFTDGDLVRPGCEPNFALLDDESLFAWGPPMQAAKFVNMAARHG